MIGWTYKNWRNVGAAAVLAAGLAACGGEGGAGGEAGGEGGGEGGEGGEAGASAPAPSPATATAPPAAGGEAGEAGAATAYAGLEGAQQSALRITHLKGFVMAASRVVSSDSASADDAAAAGVLVQQGMLEVYDIAPDQFGSVNIEIIRAAAEPTELTRAQRVTRLRAAEAELDRAVGALTDVDPAITVSRMVDIATGLYQHVIQADFVDPIEYQHSMGAAYAARSALAAGQNNLRERDRAAYTAASSELARFVALWPAAAAPEAPTPYREVLASGSRVRLALYPYL